MQKHLPFYFAIPTGASIESREQAPQHVADTFRVSGRVEFVRAEPTFRLYRIVGA